MTTHKEKAAEIRRICITANSEIGDGEDCNVCGKSFHRKIRLADIVLATIKSMDGKSKGEVKEVMLQFAYLWDCFHDSLEEQDEPTVSFLHGLLINPSYNE